MKGTLWLRVIFSLYVAGGFSLMSWLVTYFSSKCFENLVAEFGISQAESLYAEYFGLATIPPFPLGHYVQIFAIGVFALIFIAPYVLTFLKKE